MTPHWDGSRWTAALDLPEWACWRSPERPTTITVRFAGAGTETGPGEAQLAAAEHLLATHGELTPVIMRALRRYYLLRRPDFSEYAARNPGLHAELSAQLPADPTEAELDALHRLDAVVVHGGGEIGLVFWASWHPGDAVGLLLSERAVRAVGGADTATESGG